MEDLNAATLDDIKEWYRTYYGPNNAVISLAGDITPERALELVKKYFNGIPPGPPLPRTEKWIPTFDRNIRDEMQDRAPQARIYRVYHAPTWKEKELQHLGLFADVLAGSKSARLTRRLVYEKEMATDVSASLDESELSSGFYITATVKPGVDPADVEREMDSVVNELLEKGVTAEEVQRSQNRNLSRIFARHGTLRRFRRAKRYSSRKYDLRRFARFLSQPSRMDGDRHACGCQNDGEQMARKRIITRCSSNRSKNCRPEKPMSTAKFYRL